MKELITELINRLESEASSDASHKFYCESWRKSLRRKRTFKPRWLRTSMLEAAVAKSSVLDGEVTSCRRILVLFQHSN